MCDILSGFFTFFTVSYLFIRMPLNNTGHLIPNPYLEFLYFVQRWEVSVFRKELSYWRVFPPSACVELSLTTNTSAYQTPASLLAKPGQWRTQSVKHLVTPRDTTARSSDTEPSAVLLKYSALLSRTPPFFVFLLAWRDAQCMLYCLIVLPREELWFDSKNKTLKKNYVSVTWGVEPSFQVCVFKVYLNKWKRIL